VERIEPVVCAFLAIQKVSGVFCLTFLAVETSGCKYVGIQSRRDLIKRVTMGKRLSQASRIVEIQYR